MKLYGLGLLLSRVFGHLWLPERCLPTRPGAVSGFAHVGPPVQVLPWFDWSLHKHDLGLLQRAPKNMGDT